MSRTTIVLDPEDRARAKELGLNVSEVARNGIKQAIEGSPATEDRPAQRTGRGRKQSIYIHAEVIDRAKELDLNISKAAREGIMRAIAIEEEMQSARLEAEAKMEEAEAILAEARERAERKHLLTAAHR